MEYILIIVASIITIILLKIGLNIRIKDIKKVNKVEIGNSTDESNIEDSNLSSGEVNKLKEVLAEKYEIEKEKIYINGK